MQRPIANNDAMYVCPKTGQPHVPDMHFVSVLYDHGTVFVDVNCCNCGRSGCMGRFGLASEVQW